MKLHLLLLMASCALSTTFFGGERFPPSPHITVPAWHPDVFFTMIPGPPGAEQSEAFGVCYGIEADGTFSERWRVSGWYSRNLRLSGDGDFLVRLGDWSAGDFDEGDRNDGLAIAFYKRGEELKRYEISDLVEYYPRNRFSSTGPIWLHHNETPSFRGGQVFQLDTVDELRYQFDLHTGEIVSKVRREPENLSPDLTPEERVAIIWGRAAVDSRELLHLDARVRMSQRILATIEELISTRTEKIRELRDRDAAEVEAELRRARQQLQDARARREATLLQRDQLIEEAIVGLQNYPLITESRRLEVEAALRSGWMPREDPSVYRDRLRY